MRQGIPRERIALRFQSPNGGLERDSQQGNENL
jgi:hypothetical protein